MKLNIHKLMASIYRNKVHRIESAFHAAKGPFELEIKQVNDEADAFGKQVAAGKASWQEISDEGELEYDYGEALGERLDDAEDALDSLRKAFAIVAYHTWERGALRWFKYGKKKPNHADFVRALGDNGFTFDQDGLRDLKNLVNCLKHNSVTSGPELWSDRPDLFVSDFDPTAPLPITGKPPTSVDWEGQIKLTDANMDAFFETVRVSSPK